MLRIFKKRLEDSGEIVAPCKGVLMALEESVDEVFATKTLGEGFFVRAKAANIYAPVSGTITSIFPTKHAIGIHTVSGMDIMIHIGVDTVNIKDDIIACTLKVNDKIKRLDSICEVNLIAFKELGILPDVYIFVLNSNEYHITKVSEELNVDEGDIVLKCVRR